jgi:hypothetical protein
MDPSKVIHRPDLGQVVTETASQASELGFIAPVVMPYFSVTEQSGVYPVIPAKALFNIVDTKRGPKGNYNRSVENFESGIYATSENGLEMPIDERFKNIYKSMFDMEAAVANILMGKIQRAYEVRVASKIMNTSNYPHVDVSKKWTDVTADVKADVDTSKEVMRKKGVPPNLLVISWTTFLNIKKTTMVKDAIKYIFPDTAKSGAITKEHLEAYLEIDIEVAGALQNSAKKGANASLADIWSSDYAMLCRVAAPGSDISEPSVGRTLIWNEGASEDFVVEEYYEDQVRANILRVRHDTDEALLTSIDSDTKAAKSQVSKNCGLLIGNIK